MRTVDPINYQPGIRSPRNRAPAPSCDHGLLRQRVNVRTTTTTTTTTTTITGVRFWPVLVAVWGQG